MDALERLRKRKRLVKGAEITALLKRALRPKRKPNIRKWAKRLAKDTDVND